MLETVVPLRYTSPNTKREVRKMYIDPREAAKVRAARARAYGHKSESEVKATQAETRKQAVAKMAGKGK